jgi:hypothetical protein
MTMSTETCTCGATHHEGANYYVSVVDGPQSNLLAGPYKTHAEALAMVEPTRTLANELVPHSHFYSFGTVAMNQVYTKPGKLNAIMEQRARLNAVRINVTGMQGDRQVISPVVAKYAPELVEDCARCPEWSYNLVRQVLARLETGRTSKMKTAAVELMKTKLAPIEAEFGHRS